MISKNFYYVMRMSERQVLIGFFESMREYVVVVFKVMKIGNWKECKNYIINEKMNVKVNIQIYIVLFNRCMNIKYL